VFILDNGPKGRRASLHNNVNCVRRKGGRELFMDNGWKIAVTVHLKCNPASHHHKLHMSTISNYVIILTEKYQYLSSK